MSKCYLAFSDRADDCAICGVKVSAGLVGHSDDFPPLPICWPCLAGQDARLMAVSMLLGSLRAVSGVMDPDGDHAQLAEEVRELLRLIRTCLPERT